MIGVQYKFILFQDFKRHVAEAFSSFFFYEVLCFSVLSVPAMTHKKHQKVT